MTPTALSEAERLVYFGVGDAEGWDHPTSSRKTSREKTHMKMVLSMADGAPRSLRQENKKLERKQRERYSRGKQEGNRVESGDANGRIRKLARPYQGTDDFLAP